MTEEQRTPAQAVLRDHKVMFAAVPLVAGGLGISWLYLWLASGDGSDTWYLGPALALTGALVGMVGVRSRVRALVDGADLASAPGGLIVLGGLLVVAGALVPAMLAS